MPEILEPPVHHWHCAACGIRDVTRKAEPHTQMHQCPATANLNIPLVHVPTPDDLADARHIVDLGEKDGAPFIRSVGTEHGSGRVDRTVFL